MRFAALIIALFAGLTGTAFIAFGLCDDVLLRLVGFGVRPAGVARLLVEAPTMLALVGGGLVLATPLAGALALLLAALAWTGMAVLASKAAAFLWALVAFAAVAMVLAGAAVFRSMPEGETDLEPDQKTPRLAAPARPPLPSQRAALAQGRAEPAMAIAQRVEWEAASNRAPTEPRLDVPDSVDEAGVGEPEPPSRLTARAHAPFASRPAIAAPPAPVDTGDEDDIVMPAGDDLIATDARDYAGERDYFGEPREPVEVFEPFDPETVRPRRPAWRRAVAMVNLVLLIGLVGGASVLAYLDHQRGPRSAIFGTHGLLAGLEGQSNAAEAPLSHQRTQDEIAALQPLVPLADTAGTAHAAIPDNTTDTPTSAPAATATRVNPDVSPLAPPLEAVPAVAAKPSAGTGAAASPVTPRDNTAPDQQTPSAEVATAAAPSFASPDTGSVMPADTPQPAMQERQSVAQADSKTIASPATLAPNDPNAPIPMPPLPSRVPNQASAAPPPTATPAPAAAATQANTSASPAPPAPAQNTAAAATPPVPGTQTTYSDPFAYCEAVDTVDAPDKRYTGPAVPQSITDGANAKSDIKGTVHWRCMSRNVMACTASGNAPTCDQLPTVDSMVAYCRAHPNVPKVAVPSGYWLCKNGKPQIPPGQKWPADRRGFYPPAWTPIPNVPAKG